MIYLEFVNHALTPFRFDCLLERGYKVDSINKMRLVLVKWLGVCLQAML